KLNPNLPQALDQIILKALEKDPDLRYQSASELRTDLKRVKRDLDSAHAAPATSSSVAPQQPWRRYPIIAAVLVAALIAGVFLWKIKVNPKQAPTNASFRPTFQQLTSLSGDETQSSLSPDGEFIAFTSSASGNKDIYIQRIGGQNPINL